MKEMLNEKNVLINSNFNNYLYQPMFQFVFYNVGSEVSYSFEIVP